MASDLVERARQAFDALRGSDQDRLVELADPDVEWHSFFAEVGEGGVYRGHDGTRQYVRDLAEAWEDIYPQIDDSLEIGHVVLAVGRIHYRGRDSGVEADAPAGWVFRFRDGRVVLFQAFRDPERVLGSIGKSLGRL